MQYRKYGRHELTVSAIGLGGHREGMETGGGLARNARFFLSAQERARVVGDAIDGGVNYFDTTFGSELASLGESLRLLGRREELFVSGMRVDFFANRLARGEDIRTYTRREVEERLREGGLEWLDQFILGALEGGDPLGNRREIMEEALDELETLKREGKVRSVGFSSHDPNYAARLLDAFPSFDAVMVPYNYANRVAEGALAEAVRRCGAAWIAMKPLVWHAYGVSVATLRNLRAGSGWQPESGGPEGGVWGAGSPEFDPAAPIGRLAVQWILQNDLVTTTVPAMNTREAVAENLGAAEAGALTAGEMDQLAAYERVATCDQIRWLFIGGLLTENLRVRWCALHALRHQCGMAFEDFDPDADNAEEEARRIARGVLEDLRAMSANSLT